MLGRCHLKGGDCPCSDGCDAERQLQHEIELCEGRLSGLRQQMNWLKAEPRTVKPAWNMPDKPNGNYSPVVYQDLHEWHPYWSEDETGDAVEFPDGLCWPFAEDTAYAEDWRRLGFEVV